MGMKGAALSTNPGDASTTASGASEERSEPRESRERGLSRCSRFQFEWRRPRGHVLQQRRSLQQRLTLPRIRRDWRSSPVRRRVRGPGRRTVRLCRRGR
ncbi:hypothetical protein BRD06_00015 [Halobacteriales archaeon QS_9_67_15]|nr:MAG: hypothetical protein BRD06_00015 [Halobacteriales archaeon QS_9_67_15]